MTLPLMQKATAVWLVDNTTLTFTQIAEFCGLHELEVNGIADGEVAQGIKGFDPIVNRQLTPEEIRRCERDPKAKLRLMRNPAAEGPAKDAPRPAAAAARGGRTDAGTCYSLGGCMGERMEESISRKKQRRDLLCGREWMLVKNGRAMY